MGSIQGSSMMMERSGKPGRFSFFPKGALTHHPEGAVVFPSETVRSARRMRLLREPYGQCHIPLGCCHCPRSRQGTSDLEAPFMGGQFAHPFCRLPAKICHRQFYRSYGCVMFCDAPIFFFAKKKPKERTVRTNGNLSSGSKSGQPWYGKKCSCSFCLPELF